MTINKFFYLLLAVACTLTACDKNRKTTESGIEYEIYNDDEEGINAKEGDMMELHMLIRTMKDSVLRDTRDGQPFVTKLGKADPGTVEEALYLLSEGDSADIVVSFDSMYDERMMGPRPPFLPVGSKLKYTIKVLDVENEEEFRKRMLKKDEEAALHEMDELKAYLDKNGIKPITTSTGLMYTVEKSTKGKQATSGDSVTVNYTGMLLDGKVFDTSEGRGPYTLKIGVGDVIPGWDEGITLMKEGEKFRFYIPSVQAYGSRGRMPKIPPHSTLIFDLELLKVK